MAQPFVFILLLKENRVAYKNETDNTITRLSIIKRLFTITRQQNGQHNNTTIKLNKMKPISKLKGP